MSPSSFIGRKSAIFHSALGKQIPFYLLIYGIIKKRDRFSGRTIKRQYRISAVQKMTR